MHCLVTGAAGFIGSTLSEKLLSQGHKVTGVDCFVEYYPRDIKKRNIAAALQNKNYSFIDSDLCNLDLKEILSRTDVVYHQAAQAGVRASWGTYFQSYIHNNIEATQKLLEAAKSCPGISRIVFASSSSVYGNAESAPTPETSATRPVSPYGVTKLASEHLMSLYAIEMGVPAVSLRYFTVFGPRQRPDMAFNRFIRAALSGEEISLYGDGEQSRDFTYIDDIVEANILAAEKGRAGDVFNVGGGPHATVNEVLALLENEIGVLKIKRFERQQGDARHTCADISKVQAALGFNPRTSLADGLRAEIEWLRRELKA